MNVDQKQCTPHTVAAAHGVASSDAGADRLATPHLSTVSAPTPPSKPRAFHLLWHGALLPNAPSTTRLSALHRALAVR